MLRVSPQSPKLAGPRVALAQMFSSMSQHRETETTESGFGFAEREVTVVVCVIVVLWIDVASMLVVRVETCTDVETWVMVDIALKLWIGPAV
jgi:hypothetical protein